MTISGFVSICQSGSNCRTNDDRPFSVLQKRTCTEEPHIKIEGKKVIQRTNIYSCFIRFTEDKFTAFIRFTEEKYLLQITSEYLLQSNFVMSHWSSFLDCFNNYWTGLNFVCKRRRQSQLMVSEFQVPRRMSCKEQKQASDDHRHILLLMWPPTLVTQTILFLDHSTLDLSLNLTSKIIFLEK